MKRFILAAVAIALVLTSCGEGAVNTTIEGRFVGDRVDSIFLERVADGYDAIERVDATVADVNGEFKFAFKVEEGISPRLYRLSFNNAIRPITLVVAAGDNIYLDSAGDIFLNYQVQNSEESKLIEQFNKEYYSLVDRLARLSEQIAVGDKNIDRLTLEAYTAAKQAMQAQVRFVGSNQSTLAAFYASRQGVVEEYVPMLQGMGVTLPHLQALKQGIEERYPDSPYIEVLEREIAAAEAYVELAGNVVELSYPDITLDDMYKKMHSLSNYDGKVVLLYFWSAELAICNNINAELKSLYEKYHDKGFEVFQVSADSSRALWIEAVRAQQLPWLSLFGGTDPTVFTLYNVSEVPMAYLISRDGTLSQCSLALDELEEQIKSRL